MPLPEIHLSSLAYTFGHWLPRDDTFSKAYDPFDLDAPYQRGSVWTVDQRRALIKSLLMGLPTGVIIVSHLPYSPEGRKDFRIVDGKQRIETVRAFVNDEFDVPRSWFRPEYLRDPEESTENVVWSQLSDQGHRHFQMSTPMPALEFKPEYVDLGRDPETGKRRRGRRTEAGMLRAEAELYGLVNGAGTAQTEEDMEKAAKVAEEAAKQ